MKDRYREERDEENERERVKIEGKRE